jgi:cytochrome c oxidase accessory protein FixG
VEPTPQPSLESLSTVRADGSRRYVYTADVSGRFARLRRASSAVLLVVYLALPWIPVHGYPAVFLDVENRRFHLFGLTLAAQDMWLLFFLISGLGFSLFFVTALFGRVWCGWACPQTIFLDHVYRRIERWTEGDAVRRRALRDAPVGLEKIARRTAKHALYLLVSAVVAHMFLAYFASVPSLWRMMEAAPTEHWSAFVFIGALTGALYFNFAWFREQLCVVLCPYGRLQSVLVDEHSLIVGYDRARGEPRARLREAREPAAGHAGDCVDCHRCVAVCPTGIDIRQGLQLECIACTACVDACDEVMDRLDRPRGLIRYDSQAGLNGRRTRWIRPRTALYGLLLMVGAGVATWALSTVRPANLGVTRMIGAPYIVDSAFVRNQFLVRIVNKRTDTEQFVLEMDAPRADLRQAGFAGPVEVPPLGEIVQPLVLQEPRSSYSGPFPFVVRVRDGAGQFELERKVRFLGPDLELLREANQDEGAGGAPRP